MSALPLQASRLLAGNRGGVASSSRAVLPRMAGPRRAAVVVPMATAAGTKIELNKAPPSPITLTEGALSHLQKLKAEKGQDKVTLRVGVKSGGCSGMSYVMDFVSGPEELRGDDTVLPYADGAIELRIDPKSLLYLFGLTLDHSDELIGGGYKFSNPNASASCGCGTSFNV